MQVSITVDFDPSNPGVAASKIRLFAQRLDGYAKSAAPAAAAPEKEDVEPKKRGRKPKQVETDDFDFGDMDDKTGEEDEEEELFDEIAEVEARASKSKKAAPVKKRAVSMEEIQTELQAFVKRNGRDKTVKVLKTFGVTAAKRLEPSKYGEFLDALREG